MSSSIEMTHQDESMARKMVPEWAKERTYGLFEPNLNKKVDIVFRRDCSAPTHNPENDRCKGEGPCYKGYERRPCDINLGCIATSNALNNIRGKNPDKDDAYYNSEEHRIIEERKAEIDAYMGRAPKGELHVEKDL